ncbi:winged helix-turn-helix transcriptional regulator [Streptomyces sp. URMC 129]|uniref:winged helix-turn-helix transcriptional regulator n=1 Tax=Streptomyces sp. URMC 129 TaxID=3423407 RepID=UPI003F1A8978
MAEFGADCRARPAFGLMADTGNPVVIRTLRGGPYRPGDPRRRIGGVSAKVLHETLPRLGYHGLVTHRRYREARRPAWSTS